MKRPKVSIVIVTWNCDQYIRACLRSIQEQTKAEHEIIVVDNKSSDRTAQVVEKEFPSVILIKNPNNRGFAAANNQGIKVSKGENILLLNPDTVILEGAIDISLMELEKRPSTGCLGCQVWEDAETIQRTCFKYPTLVSQILILLKLGKLLAKTGLTEGPWYDTWDRRTSREVEVVSGMFMLIPSRILGEVGALDEDFFIYAEEADLCKRIRAQGYLCHFTTNAKIIHDEGGSKSTKQVKPQMYVQLRRSHLHFIRKHQGRNMAQIANTLYLAIECAKAIAFLPLSKLARTSRLTDIANRTQIAVKFHARYAGDPDA